MSDGNSDTLSFNIYGYVPSEGAGIAFIVLFCSLSIAHAGLVVRSRLWWYSVVILGGIAEILGWAGRLWSAINVYSLNAFLIQQCCLILGPCFFSAILYYSLGMLIRLLGPQHSRLQPKYYLIVFCLADLLAIVVQAVGGGMAAVALANNKGSSSGTWTMVAGIVLQLVAMLIFCYLGAEFFFKARRDPSTIPYNKRKINLFAWGLVWGSVWVLIRCIYRTIELAEGWTGYLMTHQPFFIALDAVPMILCYAGFVPAHPYFCLPSARQKGNRGVEFADSDENETVVDATSRSRQEKVGA